MRKYTLLWSAAAVGVILHIAGIGVDAYLHSHDATLAAREGIFTLANPGHVLILTGFSLTAASLIGAALVWLNGNRLGGESRFARVLRTATLPSMALAAAGTIWVLSLGEGSATHVHSKNEAAVHIDSAPGESVAAAGATADGHAHAAAPATNSAATAAGAAAADPMGEGNKHTHGTELNITPDQLVAAAEFYSKVKASSARFENIRDAMAAGYIQVTQDLPGIAAHFYNPVWARDGRLMDPDRPEVLLYSKRLDGNWRLIGFMFSDEVVKDAPPSFFGALDVWHRHENLCFTAAGVSIKASKEACVGGLFTPQTTWQMHVWTAPGATTGVFAHDFPPISPGAFPAATRSAAQDIAVRAQ